VLSSWLFQAPFKINDFRQALSNERNNPDCVRQDITLTHPVADSLCLSDREVSTYSAGATVVMLAVRLSDKHSMENICGWGGGLGGLMYCR